ncbi:hypothetical protein ACN28E_27855 [Archangium lansingense]|uniref:hypothetical protein n=1 Tax=Archangium lansingense TaxID=2995310 RepID=UPI003B7CAB45
MATNITFLIDSTKLQKGGPSINAPVAVSHPPFVLNGKPMDPEYKVPIGGGENVVIYTEEANHSQSVKVAPCGIVAHTFKGEALSPSIMKDPTLRPIDIPNFELYPGPVPDFIAYLPDDNPQWTAAPPSWPYWAGNPLISQGLYASMTRTYVPYVTFNGSRIVSGELQYGLVFGLTRDGTSVEYFYFNPYLVINS